MTFELSDFRWSALKRYHDRSLELGMSLTAYSRCWIHSHEDIPELSGPRFAVRVITDMHEFAFNARKAIEVADSKQPGVIDIARKAFPYRPQDTIELDFEETATLIDKSFWWIICRLVHSRETMVRFEAKKLEATQTRTFSQSRARVFSFRSDEDKGDDMHNVEIEALVRSYFGVVAAAIGKVIENEDRRYRA